MRSLSCTMLTKAALHTIRMLILLGAAPAWALECAPPQPPFTLNEAITNAHSIVVATLSEVKLLPRPKNPFPLVGERLGTFVVLYSLKGGLKEASRVEMLDTGSTGCPGSLDEQFIESEKNREVLVRTSNTWVLFLAGDPPYKLWETAMSRPMNHFRLIDMQRLFALKRSAG